MKAEQEEPFLPFVATLDDDRKAANLQKRRLENLKSARLGFPEWKGPAVADDLSGRCNCGSTTAFSEKFGQRVYQYQTPCRILEILEDGNRFRVAVEYGDDAPLHCRDENGDILILDLEEIWPPVDLLWREYYKQQAKTKTSPKGDKRT